MAPGRVRVLIAGNIYVRQALVRRFLQDDGYEVIGEAQTRQEIVPTVQKDQPDAVVIEDQLLEQGPVGTIPRIRAAQPDAKIVVFTSGPPPAEPGPGGPDAYLEKGVGLAALTSLLGRLLAEPISSLERAVVGATGAATSEPGEPLVPAPEGARKEEWEVGAQGRRPGRSRAFRGGAIAAGVALVLGGIIALVSSGPGPTPGPTIAQPSPSSIIPQPPSELAAAYATLDELVSALKGGNYVLATVDAQTLMADRQAAEAAGFSLVAFDEEVTARMSALAGDLPTRVVANLEDILGALFPELEEPTQPGGGSSLVLGPTTTAGGGGGSTTTTGGGGAGGGGGGGGGGAGGGGGGAGGGGGGGEETTLGPGDGRAWGQSHKPPKNGWNGRRPAHHGKPAWAQGPKS